MSKHIIYMTVAFFLLSTLTLWAQFQESGKSGITTVSDAQEALDDSRVSLTGTILRQLGEEQYLFQDATGTMIVEIDRDDWGNVTVNPETVLHIWGEVDRDWETIEVEVERIEPRHTSRQSFKPFPRNQSDTMNTIEGVKDSSLHVSQLQLH